MMGETLLGRVCGHCGSEFAIRLAAVNAGGGKFCSRSCSASARTGARNSNWRGGRVVDPFGRVLIYAPGHPQPSYCGTHVYEYRLVAEATLGRFLDADEIVHHINGDPADNSPENLEVMTQSEHIKRHLPEMNKRRLEVLHGV